MYGSALTTVYQYLIPNEAGVTNLYYEAKA